MTGMTMLLALWAHSAGWFGPASTGDSRTVAVWDAQTKQFVAPSDEAREALARAARAAPEAAAQVVEEPASGPAGGFRVRLKGAAARSAFVVAVESSGEVVVGCEGATTIQEEDLALGEGSMAADGSGEEVQR